MHRSHRHRFIKIMLGIFFMLLALSGSFGFSNIIFFLIGMMLLKNQLQMTQGQLPQKNVMRANPKRKISEHASAAIERFNFPETEEEPTTVKRIDEIYPHALKAVEAAGLNPDTTYVLPVDIGLMSFTDNQTAVIWRTKPIYDDIDYLQPFVELKLPITAMGKIRFEVLDADGESIFVHEEIHHLKQGRNLITPRARIPIHDAYDLSDDWTLNVSADGVLIATQIFGWQESDRSFIRRHVREDGEISSEMRAMIEDSSLQRMSLDDLLQDQDDSSVSAQRRN